MTDTSDHASRDDVAGLATLKVRPVDDRNDRFRLAAQFLPVVLPFLVLVMTGLRGINFGYHWDEAYHLRGVVHSIQTGIPAPGLYLYPSVAYWLHVLGALPEVIAAAQVRLTTGQGMRQQLIDQLSLPAFNLKIRSIFVFVSALGVVWVYLSTWVWRKSWVEGLLAASIFGLGWEFAYHSRWIAVDAIMTQFAALTMLCITCARVRNNHRFWLRCAAIATGLACGTKYPAGLLFLPVSIAAYQCWDQATNRALLVRLWFELAAIAGVTYLISTPGTIIQFTEFWQGVHHNMLYYQESHWGHTVSPGPQHLGNILLYLSMSLLSTYPPIALLFFALGMVGSYGMYRQDRASALLWLSFPVTYALYFSMYRVMIVRNLLVLTPFLAVLSAYGAVTLLRNVRKPVIQVALGAMVAVFLLLNGMWLVSAAQTIVDRGTNRFVGEVAAYIDARPHTAFWLSPRVRADLAALDGKQRSNVVIDQTQLVHTVVLYAFEGFPSYLFWPANQPDLTTAWFGPREVNFNYYPSWGGDDRIVLLPYLKAHEIGVQVLK